MYVDSADWFIQRLHGQRERHAEGSDHVGGLLVANQMSVMSPASVRGGVIQAIALGASQVSAYR
jgi:hypothetical protein